MGDVAPAEGDGEVEGSSHVDAGYYALVLVLTVDSGVDATVEEVGG